MGMTLIEKILASHSGNQVVVPEQIVDVTIDARAARDFGGANVVKNIRDNNLTIADPARTFFTFDCNPTGSDQKYAANQQKCRDFAKEHGIKVYDISAGIGTHLLIEEGLVYPGATAVSTDSHANILGAIGVFGQGMGDQDIAAAWHQGSVWFKVPHSVKITIEGQFAPTITAKDIVLNLLAEFGANKLLGYSVELYGEAINQLTLDQRITIASMATEMGAIIILFTPNHQVMEYCEARTGRKLQLIKADEDAIYKEEYKLHASRFMPRVSRPGHPHDTIELNKLDKIRIDSAFIGSCTNGRMEDMRAAAAVLKGKKVAPGVVLKIVPSTDEVWKQSLSEGLVAIFKEAGALLSNAGCAGCAAGQVGQNGPGEVTIGTGNRNFPGKQGQGEVYLATPAVVAASAVAGYITDPEHIFPEEREVPKKPVSSEPANYEFSSTDHRPVKPNILKGHVWVIMQDNIDTDMIFHNRYLAITDLAEMGQYTFDNLKGYEDFAKKAKPGDIVVTGKNFGAGSSRQQAVDCFKSLGIQAIVGESFGAIYERNAINAAFPVIICENIPSLELENGEELKINLQTGEIQNISKKRTTQAQSFSSVQLEIYQRGGLLVK